MNRYHYYDTPDGQDPFKKLFYTCKHAICASLFVASTDVQLYSHTKGFAQTLDRYAWHVVPLVGMAATFTTVTYAATNIRGKDDRLNPFLGGLAAGVIFGKWQKCGTSGFVAALTLGVVAYLKKSSIEEGWTFFPMDYNRMTGSYRGALHDFTIMKDRPKGWTTA